jgi:outer membrane protein
METHFRACLRRRKGVFEGILVLFLWFVLLGTAGAENEKKVVLTLPQLIEMAVSKSPEIAEAKSDIVSSQSDLDQVKAAYYPQLESAAIIGPVSDAKRPIVHGTRLVDTTSDSIGAFGRIDFILSQPLYTFGKLSNRKEAASRGVRAKEFQVTERKNEIALRVKELYYALVLSRAGLEVSREASAFFEDARQRMNRLLEVGSTNVIESDLYRVDAYQADTLRSRAEAEKGAKVAYFALKSLIFLPAGTEFEPAEKMLTAKDAGFRGLEDYIQKAYTERPELKQLEEALAAQDSQIKATQSDRYPSFFVALEGSLAGAPGRETLHNAYIQDEFNHANVGVIAGIKWDFDFGIRKARIEKEKAEYQKFVHKKANGKLNIPIQVAKYYQEVLEWKTSIDTYTKAALSSRKWVVTAMTNFDMGVGTADDMLRAIEKYGYNRGKYVESLFNYNLSLAALTYAIGVTEQWE